LPDLRKGAHSNALMLGPPLADVTEQAMPNRNKTRAIASRKRQRRRQDPQRSTAPAGTAGDRSRQQGETDRERDPYRSDL
jgi:hypothetical protein